MKRRYHFHLPIFIFMAAIAVVAVAAMNSQKNLLFWVLGMMVALLLFSFMISGVMPSGLHIRRLDPRHGTVGEPLLVRYAVTNRNRFFSIFNITIEDLSVAGETTFGRLMRPVKAWVMHVGPGETVHGEAVCWPHRRGEARFSTIRVTSSFPFGLIKRSVTIVQRQHTLIYPMVYELQPRVLNAISPTGSMGVRMSQSSGKGDEYFGMREYREGDSSRQISWKRSASRDSLITIERTQPNPPRLRVAIDLTTATAELPIVSRDGVEGARELEERAISLAASLIRMAEFHGFEVGLTIVGTNAPSIPLRRSQWHAHKMMAALAAIDLDAVRISMSPSELTDTERAGLVIVHPDRVQMLSREAAWHITASQLAGLAVRPLGATVGADVGANVGGNVGGTVGTDVANVGSGARRSVTTGEGAAA